MLRQWAMLIGLALLGLLGLYGAAEARSEGGYLLGLLLAVACILLDFQVLKRIADKRPDYPIEIMPRTATGANAMIVVMAAVCLGAIVLAASGDPYFYYAGLGVAAVAFVLALLGIRARFDAVERQGNAS